MISFVVLRWGVKPVRQVYLSNSKRTHKPGVRLRVAYIQRGAEFEARFQISQTYISPYSVMPVTMRLSVHTSTAIWNFACGLPKTAPKEQFFTACENCAARRFCSVGGGGGEGGSGGGYKAELPLLVILQFAAIFQ